MSSQIDPVRRLKATIGAEDEVVALLAAPLWARVGRTLSIEDLRWAHALGGEEVSSLLWQSLVASGALSGDPAQLRAPGLSQFIAAFLSDPHTHANAPSLNSPQLLWTLPAHHPRNSIRGSALKDALIDLIRGAQSEIVLVSPYFDAYGMGEILNPLLDAFGRGVKVLVLTHDALNVASLTSRALEVLRREAERIGGALSVYSGEIAQGRGRTAYPLLHAKLFIVDHLRVLMGSANVTSYALSSNFEVGVLLGSTFAEESRAMTMSLIEARLAYLVFATNQD